MRILCIVLVALAVAFAHTEAAELERREPLLDALLDIDETVDGVTSRITDVVGVALTVVGNVLTTVTVLISSLAEALTKVADNVIDLLNTVLDSLTKCGLEGTLDLILPWLVNTLTSVQVALLVKAGVVLSVSRICSNALIPVVQLYGQVAVGVQL